jgi:hypothetical protein
MVVDVAERPFSVPSPRRDLPWALRSLALSRLVAQKLQDMGERESAARDLAKVIAPLEPVSISPASAEDELLTRRVAQILGVGVRPISANDQGRHVILDTVVNTGVDLSALMKAAARIGHRDVWGAALVAQESALQTRGAEGDRLVAAWVVS